MGGDSITNGCGGGGGGTVVNSPVNIVISSGSGNGASVGNVWVQNTLTVTTFTSNGSATFTGTTSFVEVNAQFLVGDGSGIANLNASNITSGTLDQSHLQTTGVVPQPYGDVTNIPQLVIDQWGRVSNAVNIPIQWTPTYLFNIATANAVSIGTLNDPPTGSNLYVLGTANVTTMNVDTLFANTVTIFGLNTLNVYGTSNMNSVYASNIYGNAAGLSNISGSSVTGNVSSADVALVVSGAAQPNITSVGVLTNLVVQGQVTISNGSAISNLNSSNLVGNVANANVALVVSGASQPNITSVGTLTSLTVNGGVLIASNGSGISNLNSSNLVGNVASANVALVVSGASQPNITSIGTLTGLNVQGLLVASNGSGISNINGSNVTGNVANSTVALTVSGNTQSNITSLGTLVSLDVSGQITGDGYGITNLNPLNINGTVRTAASVTVASQPNITSVGTLTALNVQGLASISNGSAISNLNSSNIFGTVYAAQVVTQNAQPNITSVGILSGLTVQGLLVASNGSGISNLNSSNLVGNVAQANVALVVSGTDQPNITSVGTLTSLNVQGLLIASDGSGIANVRAANVTGTVATAGVVTNPAQVNITSVGTLTSLTVSGILTAGAFNGNGYALSNLNSSNIIGAVPLADSVVNAAQPNITSVGLLSNLDVSNSVTTGNVWANSLSVTALSGKNPVKFVSDSGSLLMTNTGRIGLNMNNPTSQLEIGATGATSIAVNLSDTSIGAGNGVSLTKDASQNMIIANQSLADSWLVNYGTTRFRMYSTSSQSLLGPVYMGPTITTTPSLSTTLYVLGNVYATNSLVTTNVFASLANITSSNITTQNVGTINVFTGANVTQLVVSGLANLSTSNIVTLNAASANITTGNIGFFTVWGLANLFSANAVTLNTASANVTSGNVGSLNVFTGANVTQLTVSGLSNLFSANAVTLNTASANVTSGNVGSLNVFTGANVTQLTVSGLANLFSANAVTLNTASANVTSGNVGSLNVFTGANVTQLTVSGLANIFSANVLTANITTANTGLVIASTGFSGTAFTGGTFQGTTFSGTTITASTAFLGGTVSGTTITATTGFSGAAFTGGTFQGSTMSGTTITASTGFTGASFTGGTFQGSTMSGTTITASTGFTGAAFTGGTFQGLSANVQTLNTASANVTSGNVGSLNVFTGANITTLTVSTISNIVSANILTANLLSANIQTQNVSFLNVSLGANITTLTGTLANIATLNTASLNVFSENVLSLNVYTGANISTLTVSTFANLLSANIITINSASGNITSENVSFLNVTSTLVVSGLSNLQTLNATSVTMLQANVYGGLGANVAQFNIMRAGTSNAANSYIQTLYASNIYSNNVAAIATNVQYLTVTSNILPGVATGNTYLTGNIIVSGNVYTSIGAPLGAGGGYYFSLPGDIAIQPSYTGAIYGTTYPLSVGLSNGFTINGTSTIISVTTNGNFKFTTPGAYIISAVFAGSDNITGLALGSNVADIHGTDQGYLYRYTTQITQNPTELIEIPFNVTDVTKYYYLDLFVTASGTLKATTSSSGGTYLTITPLQGGGLATGGPGGTPGTQWISSGSNIYFPNSIGVGAVNPAYNLDVSTGNTATQTLITSNISSLGLYGPTLNISSNVLIQSNLAVGGGIATTPPYALYVTGQGYFSQQVSYANFAGYRNRCVNGTFRVAARANSITVSNTSVFSYSNTWVVDRWRVDVGGLATSNVSFSVKQDVPLGTTNGFTQCANVYVSRALTGTTGNTWVCPLSQTIEASFIFDFRWGQPTGKPAVFSFYANTTVSGDYSVVFRSRVDNTYFANLVSITAGTWATHVIYLPACLIGNWAQPATDGYLDVLIGGVSYGTNSSNNRAVAVTSSWTANPGFAPVSCIGATKWPATTGLVMQITGPQLEEGTISTPFEVRPLTQTLIYCQRFFETNPNIQYASALGSGRINSVPFVVTKRNNANVSIYRDLSNLTANTNISQFVAYYGDGTLKGTQAINSYMSSEYGFSFNFTNTGSKFMDASIMEAQFIWAADAEIY
jgi:hypothetical protein